MTKPTRHSELCAAVRKLLTGWGCLAFPVKQGPTPFKAKDGSIVYGRGALRPGVSDVIACGPGGRFVAVEVKVERDKLSRVQAAFLTDVTVRNGVAIECRDTVEAVLDMKKEICREV